MSSKTKDSQIVEAALKLFKERGFAAVRISDIAKEAGVGKGTVYEYFSSKEELLIKACILSCSESGDEIEAILENEQNLNNPVKIVHRTLEVVLNRLLSKTSDENKMLYELSVLAAGNPDLREMVQESFEVKLNHWQDMIVNDYKRGLESGHFRAVAEPQELARFLVAAVDGIIWQTQWCKNENLQEHARQMANVYCQLILVEPDKLEDFLK